MQAVLAVLAYVVNLLLAILPLVQMIRDLLPGITREHIPYYVRDVVTNTQLAIQNPTYGLAAIHADLATDRSLTAIGINDILAAVGAPAQAPSPPSWWIAPPTPPSIGDIAEQVWMTTEAAVVGNDGEWAPHSMMDLVDEIWNMLTRTVGTDGLPHPNNPYFSLVGLDNVDVGGYWWNWNRSRFTAYPAVPDWTQLLSTDTPLSFLERTQPSLSWTLHGPWSVLTDGETVWLATDAAPGHSWWRFNVTQLELLAMVPPVIPETPAALVAPVWPGLAGVTYGTPLALTDGRVVPGPLDGVVVAITSTPAHGGKYGFGTVDSYTHVGGIIFASDGGEYESALPIAVETHVICPKTMVRASSAIVRLNGGYGGTITPWTRTV